jgi:hypothetical protein
MKKTVCSLLVLAILSLAVPAAADESEKAQRPSASSIRAAIAQSGTELAQVPSAARVRAQIPRTLPRSGSDQIRKQGGSGKMVFGIVTTLVGVAATVYMVKQMKEDTDEATKNLPQ